MNIMKLRISLLFGVLFIMSLCITGVTYASVTEEEQRIFDEAGLLTAAEYEELEAMCLEYGGKANVEIFILTHNNPNSVYPEKYIEDFEDRQPAADKVYFLYDVYRGEIFIEGYGTAESYIHSKRIEKIFDQMENDLRSGDYYGAFATYIDLTASYMKDDSDINTDHDYSYKESSDPDYVKDYDYDSYYDEYNRSSNRQAEDFLTNFWFQLIVALVIGGIAVGVMAYNSGGKMTVRGNDYLDQNRSGLIGRRDIYLRTTITKVKRPTQNNSGGKGGFNAGGFRGGVSSGGRSHSSGGRKL